MTSAGPASRPPRSCATRTATSAACARRARSDQFRVGRAPNGKSGGMPDLLSLPFRAADLTLRTARWAIGQVLDRVRGEDDAEATPSPAASPPAAPPPPQDDPPRPASKRRAAVKKPSPKQA